MNWPRFCLALIWFVTENDHFGWQVPLTSDAALLADGIAVILFMLACEGRNV